MNEWNPLETQLRSWTPRRPSAGLERRLFRPAAAMPWPANPFGWLVPVAACLLFGCFVLNQQSVGRLSATPLPGPMVAAIMSNQSYAAYLPGSFHSSHYHLEAFEWTNGNSFTESNHSIPPAKESR